MSSDPTDSGMQTPEKAWSLTSDETMHQLCVADRKGLSQQEVLRRQQVLGRNVLQTVMSKSLTSILIEQFKSLIVLLLLVAAILALLFSELLEGIAILAVIIINTSIGFLSEWRALRSMEALRRLGHVQTRVVRDSVATLVSAESLVPGDLVLLEGGDIVSADMRLIEAVKLQSNESTLTGESIPVRKHTDILAERTLMADRRNMVFKGTAITRGTGRGVVVATGLHSELGRISQLVSTAESQQTPLEQRLTALGTKLAWVVIVLAVLIAGIGILAGRELFLAMEVAIALAVAAIPEGLPIVATIALARGMWRMAKRNALIARLSAVETLGATSIILSDKTGTLTENHMAVTAVQLPEYDLAVRSTTDNPAPQFLDHDQPVSAARSGALDELLTIAALCTNATARRLEDGRLETTGDPTEVALMVAAAGRDLWYADLIERYPELGETPFDADTKLMATHHHHESSVVVAVKGAPEAVIPCCTSLRTSTGDASLTAEKMHHWLTQAAQMGERGLRTLAVATRLATEQDDAPYENLTLLGIVGLEDPPRTGVKEAIEACHSAGISIIMATGDHAATARNIATAVNIVGTQATAESFISGADFDARLNSPDTDALLRCRVFSRVTPEQKLRLINFYQQQGHIVAMTGDGVNDAPALKKADIGIAMGVRGTEVAKEAASMVLQDDEFSTISNAVAEGRAIFANIRKFVVYLFSCNISEVLVVSIATLAGAPLPLLPLQILFLNLITDVFPALALGVGEGAPSLMERRPRPSHEPILTRYHWVRIGLHAMLMATTVLVAMLIAVKHLQFAPEAAITVSFCTLALAQMWHVFNMRDSITNPVSNEITRNPWIWIALALCLMLILAAVYVPHLSELLKLEDPGATGWLLILLASLVPLLCAPLVRIVAGSLANSQDPA